MIKPKIKILKDDFTIHKLNPEDTLPEETIKSKYSWISKTEDELSVVCESGLKLQSEKSDDNWAAIKLIGPIDFSEVGILADISKILAGAGISIFALSTFDTDYILIKKSKIDDAVAALERESYTIEKQ